MKSEINLLSGAASEIIRLRRDNELMSARLQMFDNMMLLFTTEPNFARRGFAPDIVIDLQKKAEELKNATSE